MGFLAYLSDIAKNATENSMLLATCGSSSFVQSLQPWKRESSRRSDNTKHGIAILTQRVR